VRLLVRPQVAAVRKTAATFAALERLLSGVGADVALQQPRPRERLATNVALARKRVCPDVHL
jgi:hypothetical protein